MTEQQQPCMSQELFEAIMDGDAERIHACLDAGESVHSFYYDDIRERNWTPLSWAEFVNSAPAVLALLERGADPNPDARLLLDWAYDKVLDWAYEKDSPVSGSGKPAGVEIILAMLKAGLSSEHFDINQPYDNLKWGGETLLGQAAKNDDTVTIDELMKLGARVDVTNKAGLKPLHTAAKSGSTEAFKALLRHGAPLDACTYGLTVMDFVVMNNRGEMLASLLEDPRLSGSADLDKLLVQAARAGADKVVGELLDRGADPCAVNENGDPLLKITKSEQVRRLVRAARTAALLKSAMPDAEAAPSTPSSGGMQPL